MGGQLRARTFGVVAVAVMLSAIPLWGADRSHAEDAKALVGLAAFELEENNPLAALAWAREALALDPEGESAKDARRVLCRAKARVPESQARTAELAPLLGAVSDSEPRPIDRPAPAARRLWGVQNVVVVHATIDEEGCVRDAEVEGTVLQPLEKTVLAAVGNWVFEPASENGKPVARPYSTKVRLSWTQRSDSTADLYRPIAATGTLYSLRVY